MVMSKTWNENTPASTDLISGGPTVIKDLKIAIRERMDVEHVFTTGNEATVGAHAAGFITESSTYVAAAAITNANIKDATATPGAAKIPIANGSGKLANGWLNTGTGNGLDADTLDGSHASAFAVAAKGVTNGDTHDHSGGDGNQINHTTLSNIGTNTHAQIDTAVTNSTNHIAASAGSVHGITASAAEVNKLAGLATTKAELGYVAGVTSAIQTQLNAKQGNPNVTAGNAISFTSAASVTNNTTTYVKKKEFTTYKTGTLRIVFTLQNSSDDAAYGRIYRNGVAVGTERTANTAPITFSEDISGWSSGDKIQLYIKTQFQPGYVATAYDFIVRYNDPAIMTIDTE